MSKTRIAIMHIARFDFHVFKQLLRCGRILFKIRVIELPGVSGEAETRAAAEELAAKIKGQVVTAKVKGGASGKLYGKVTGKEVAELLTALTGTEIDKKKVELPSAIKEFGSYDASVRLYAGVVAPFKLKVEEL